MFDLVYCDPCWPYTPGNQNPKGIGASHHYDLMSWDELSAMPVRDICAPKAACLMWATGPFLDRQIEVLKDWGFNYRGVAFVWAKTRADGEIIGAQGGVPTFVKSTAEFLLYGTTCKTGRPYPIHDFKVRQIHLAPKLSHSQKPESVRDEIDRLVGDVRKIELFARRPESPAAGWTQSGWEFNGADYRTGELVHSSVILPL